MEQLAALAGLHEALERAGIDYWVFGGWAVDLHAGRLTRAHEDLDIAVWATAATRLAAVLSVERWRHAPEAAEDGFTVYVREGVRLEVAFLARDGEEIYTPLADGRGEWPPKAFGTDVGDVSGVRARVVGLRALRADKAERRDDPAAAAKDRADSRTLAALG